MEAYSELIDIRIIKVIKKAYGILNISSNKNHFEIAKKLGITISFCDFNDDLKGFLADGIIYINNKLDLYSQKIVCSHEIGHFVLHRYENDAELFDPDSKELMEFEANIFVFMLMPQVFSRFALSEYNNIYEFNQYIGKQIRYA